MNKLVVKNIIDKADTSGVITSTPFSLAYFTNFALQLILTGTPSGTIVIQTSNEGVVWDEVLDSSLVVDGYTSFTFQVNEVNSKQMRVQFIPTNGNPSIGTLTVSISAKG